ncbi:D-2-hydroxyacid dehydrogenase [Chloroflexota bacterium]
MELVNVLASRARAGRISTAIDEETLRKITAVSPRVKLVEVSDLLSAEQRGDMVAKENLDALLAEAEVLFALRAPQNVVARAPKLKWVQTMSAGVNMFLAPDLIPVDSPVILTNTRGVQSVTIAEFTFGLMLMFAKQSLSCFQLKQEKQWKPVQAGVKTLRSKTVGIVGLGSVGREVARLAKAFGMRVLAEDIRSVARARYVDTMLRPDQLLQLLSESDFVVLSLALTPETNKLIGEKELRAMKPTAYLINIARGPLIDEEVLIHALEEHWIAGAGLDVFATEPLPTDSKLWELPNVIISPHTAGAFEDRSKDTGKVFLENLRRYVSGKRLLNVIDKKKGW